jgi:hypothetical protein
MKFGIYDDNAATVDLLGFDTVVAPMVEAIASPSTGPLTIGIRGNWGTGKSTLLRLVRAGLETRGGFLTLVVDPWEFESGDAMRAALTESVLLELDELLPDESGVRVGLRRLLARVRFGKIATAALKGAVTMPLDGGLGLLKQVARGLVGRVDEFVAEPEDGEIVIPADMRGFRSEFHALIEQVRSECKIEKVVVLVDDLDRCMPTTIVEALEAIKLFLSVEHMVFVLAADEGMVRSALSAHVVGTGRIREADEGIVRFADQYLEKIIQLPFTIPFLTEEEAVTYATLLLCSMQVEGAVFDALVAHCADRRKSSEQNLLAGFSQPLAIQQWVQLAAQICEGMSADRRMRPRQIKRFLNSLTVRRSIATSRNIKLEVQAMAKLLLLEEEHLETGFRVLVEASTPTRDDLLSKWEAWGRGDEGGVKPEERVGDDTRRWAGSEPSLVGVPIDSYLTLAASLVEQMTTGIINERVANMVKALLGSGAEAHRKDVLENHLPTLSDADLNHTIREICNRSRHLGPVKGVRALVEIAEIRPDVASTVTSLIEMELIGGVEATVAPIIGMSKNTDLMSLADRLSQNPVVDESVRKLLADMRNLVS